MPGFQSFLGFSHHFLLAKSATSSIKVKVCQGVRMYLCVNSKHLKPKPGIYTKLSLLDSNNCFETGLDCNHILTLYLYYNVLKIYIERMMVAKISRK